jgi:hypothetical protein
MNPIELILRVTVDETSVRAIVNVIRQAMQVGGDFDEKRSATKVVPWYHSGHAPRPPAAC